MAEKLASGKHRCIEAPSKFRNCRFILGSAVEVERLWSVCKYILTDHRKSTTPRLFESLIFLKVNATFWDQGLVSEAMKATEKDICSSQFHKRGNPIPIGLVLALAQTSGVESPTLLYASIKVLRD
eukprot:IDg83t1